MTSTLHIVLSVGGTKIGTGAIDGEGNIVIQLPEIPTPRETHNKYDAIGAQVALVADELDIGRVAMVGVSFPECIPPPKRVVADPESLPAEKSHIQKGIEAAISNRLGKALPIEVLHDAAAAVLGEVSCRGTLPFCEDAVFIVWGTGVASGIVHKGKLYWSDPEIGIMTGEIGLLTIRSNIGVYEYRPERNRIHLLAQEETLDQRHRGPAILRRCLESIPSHPQGQGFLEVVGKPRELVDLKDINRGARGGNAFAIDVIEEAGREMGRALVPFISYWRDVRRMDFIDNIIIGSGVAKIGDGVRRNGKDSLIEAVREGIREAWATLETPVFDVNKVILSRIGYEREFCAFIP